MISRAILQEALDGAAEVVAPTDLSKPVCSLERALSASWSLVFRFDDSTGGPVAIGGSLSADLLDEYRRTCFEDDPLQQVLTEIDPVKFVVRSDTLPLDPNAFVRTDAYRRFYKRLDAEQLLGIWPTDLRYGTSEMIGILFARSRLHPPFSHEEERALLHLRKALSQAARRAQRFGQVMTTWIAAGSLVGSPSETLPARGTPVDADLIIGPDCRWIRSPDGEVWPMDQRFALQRIVAALVEKWQSGGECLSLDALIERGWPGDRSSREAAINRIHVALSTLRRMGLRSLLQRTEQGYRLAPDAPLHVVTSE